MDKYDPMLPLNATEWLAMEEAARIELVKTYHLTARIVVPNPQLHACMHVMVENQIALDGITEVKQTLERLQKEGLDRHEAVHAIASIVSSNIYRAMKNNKDFSDDEYRRQLEGLTARQWASGE